MSQPKYKIYPSLLDAFRDMVNAPDIWEKFWGNSETPKMTLEEYVEKTNREFLDKVNRAPHEPIEAADRGTAFNEVVDTLIHNKLSETVEMKRIEQDGVVVGVGASLNGFTFEFDINLIRDFVRYYQGAQSQVLVSGILPTAHGDVELYGYIDELMPFSVHDIKTTGRYEPFKFKDHAQHLVYPYCLQCMGNDVKTFEYNITDFSDVYTETYVFESERDIPRLRAWVEDLIGWLEDHRDQITDKKIFGEI